MKIPLAVPLLVLACQMGCQSGPAPRVYVLGPPASEAEGLTAETNRPVLELRRISLPDYLDTSDMLRRGGRNELTISTTGRWGERLSVGIARALRAGLARRLEGTIVTGAAAGQTARRLSVDVEAFDAPASGPCVLTARWALSGTAVRGTFVSRTVVPDGPNGDAALAAAMSEVVDRLAGEIARSVEKRGT